MQSREDAIRQRTTADDRTMTTCEMIDGWRGVVLLSLLNTYVIVHSAAALTCYAFADSRLSIRRHGLDECYRRQRARARRAWFDPFRCAFAGRRPIAGCVVSSVAAGAHTCPAVLLRRVDLVVPRGCALGLGASDSARGSSAHGAVSGAVASSERVASRAAGTMCSNTGMMMMMMMTMRQV